MSAIRVIKHEAVPGCGSFDVRFPDDRPSQYFYRDYLPTRRLRPETLDRETALERGKAVASREELRAVIRVSGRRFSRVGATASETNGPSPPPAGAFFHSEASSMTRFLKWQFLVLG